MESGLIFGRILFRGTSFSLATEPMSLLASNSSLWFLNCVLSSVLFPDPLLRGIDLFSDGGWGTLLHRVLLSSTARLRHLLHPRIYQRLA